MSVKKPIFGLHPQTDVESVRKALHKTKKVKASGTSGIASEMLLASGDVGIERKTNLFNKIIAENKVSKYWGTSVIVNCFKKEGDGTERRNYRGNT